MINQNGQTNFNTNRKIQWKDKQMDRQCDFLSPNFASGGYDKLNKTLSKAY